MAREPKATPANKKQLDFEKTPASGSRTQKTVPIKITTPLPASNRSAAASSHSARSATRSTASERKPTPAKLIKAKKPVTIATKKGILSKSPKEKLAGKKAPLKKMTGKAETIVEAALLAQKAKTATANSKRKSFEDFIMRRSSRLAAKSA